MCGPKRFLVALLAKRAQVEAGVLAQLQANADATLEQHCEMWEQTHGEYVRSFPMSRAIKQLGWTRKKVDRGDRAQRRGAGGLARKREPAPHRPSGVY